MTARSGPVTPRSLGTSDAAKPEVEDGIGVRGVPLVPGKHQAGQLHLARTGNGLRGTQVGAERGLTLPRFEAEVMGERMRSHFLANARADELNK